MFAPVGVRWTPTSAKVRYGVGRRPVRSVCAHLTVPSLASNNQILHRRALLWLVLIAALWPLTGCRPSDAGDTPTPSADAALPDAELPDGASNLKVATWNLNWLSGGNYTGQVPRSDDDYDALARYATQLDADVIAVQEVQSDAALARVFDNNEYAFHVSTRDSSQKTAFVVRRSLLVTRYPDYTALRTTSGMRHGVDIGVRIGDEELRLLSIHLKSGCFDDPLNSGFDACYALAEQVPVLEAWVDARAREGVPFAVLGDFNRRFAEGLDEVYRALDDGVPSGANLTLVTEGFVNNCYGRSREFIDHIVLGEKSSEWFDRNTFHLLDYPVADRQYELSDHCAVAITLSR